jgi:hypothetical protein
MGLGRPTAVHHNESFGELLHCVDAHRNGRLFAVRSDELLTAILDEWCRAPKPLYTVMECFDRKNRPPQKKYCQGLRLLVYSAPHPHLGAPRIPSTA